MSLIERSPYPGKVNERLQGRVSHLDVTEGWSDFIRRAIIFFNNQFQDEKVEVWWHECTANKDEIQLCFLFSFPMPTADQLRDQLINEVIHRLYDESLTRILQCLDELNDNQIWSRPNESSNSIGNLVLHLCGNVTQWIGSGLGGYADHRNRQTEFDEHGPIKKEELIARLNSTMEMARPIIKNLPAEELLLSRPVQTFEETGLTILIHVTEHFSYHTGQIAYITKMLNNKPLDFYAGVILQ